jgi:hypothetical protein
MVALGEYALGVGGIGSLMSDSANFISAATFPVSNKSEISYTGWRV